MRKLSDAQVHMLAQASNSPVTPFWAATQVRNWRKTMSKLTDLGLVVFHPYASGGEGAYKLTPEGRAKVKELLASGALVPDTVKPK